MFFFFFQSDSNLCIFFFQILPYSENILLDFTTCCKVSPDKQIIPTEITVSGNPAERGTILRHRQNPNLRQSLVHVYPGDVREVCVALHSQNSVDSRSEGVRFYAEFILEELKED